MATPREDAAARARRRDGGDGVVAAARSASQRRRSASSDAPRVVGSRRQGFDARCEGFDARVAPRRAAAAVETRTRVDVSMFAASLARVHACMHASEACAGGSACAFRRHFDDLDGRHFFPDASAIEQLFRCVLYKRFSPIARFQRLIASPFN
jgi:hypothetical protein